MLSLGWYSVRGYGARVKGKRHGVPSISCERPLTWPVRDKREDTKGRAVQSQRQLKLSTARVGYHFRRLSLHWSCVSGVTSVRTRSQQRGVRFPSLHHFYTSRSRRIQDVPVPLGQADPCFAGGTLESPFLLFGDAQSEGESAGFAGRQFWTAHAFTHGETVAQKESLCSTKIVVDSVHFLWHNKSHKE